MSVFRMSQKEKSEPTFRARLINVKGKGLGWKDQDGVFKPVSNLSIKCVAPIALQVKSLKGKITSFNDKQVTVFFFYQGMCLLPNTMEAQVMKTLVLSLSLSATRT